MSQVTKFISQSLTLEVGDFYGAGQDEVVKSMEDKDHEIEIVTSHDSYEFRLQPGDYMAFSDGSSRIMKSKYDNQDE